MPVMMSIAEHVDKLHAICMVCGGGIATQRLVTAIPPVTTIPS
jgi:thymidine kinase